MAQSHGGYKDDNTVNEDDISTVNTEGHPSAEPTQSMSYKSSHYKEDDYSPGQSSVSQQRLKSLKVPPELLNASSSGSQKKKVSRGGRYTVKVHTVTTWKTFGADEVLLSRVKNSEEIEVERTDQQRCDVIILFCPIISRVDLDVDAAMSEISVSAGDKPVILVLMYHTWKVDYSPPEKKWSETFGDVVLDVDVLFHETERGLLECPKNQEAVNQIRRELLKYRGDQTPPGQSTQQSLNQQNVPPELVAAVNTLREYYDQRHTNPNIQRFFEGLKEEFATALSSNTDTGSSSGSQEKKVRCKGGYTVKVHTVTTGETFGADEDLLSRVNCEKLEVERTDQQRCDVIILFCPIISRVDLDVNAAMSEISVSAGGKPVILVLMHHTRKVDYSTPEKKWSETFENVVLDVDVLFHETKRGLLECSKNQEAVNQIQRELLKYRGTVCKSEKSSNQLTDVSCCIS